MPNLRRSIRFWLWLVPAVFYAVFWFWYTPLGGPMSEAEIDDAVALFEDRGTDPETIASLRDFFQADDGRSFIMVNVLDMADRPQTLPATGPDASAQELLDYYMEYMTPALIGRASHPVFMGRAVHSSLDVVGIDGAERWDTAALMRYRSRRDMLAISAHPSFRDRHAYKVAALTKTIAYPVAPQLFLSDPRLLLALFMLTILALIDMLVWRRNT